MNILAESKNYILESEYETVFLLRKSGKVKVGDFYGDPEAAIIDKNEKWCVIVGCGLIIYYLEKPFKPYEYNYKTKQWVEFFRGSSDILWIDSIIQKGNNVVEFVAEGKETYNLEVETLKIRKL